MSRKILVLYLAITLAFMTACSGMINVVYGYDEYIATGVRITNKGNYFDVVLDYTTGISPWKMGSNYARAILEMVPDYEELVDSYISQTITQYNYPYIAFRVEDIWPQVPENYRMEIEGMAEQFSGGDNDLRGDNKISKNEFMLFNLFPDVYRWTQCSFVSVFGDYSDTGKNITARNLDWYGGDSNQLPQMQAVITIKYPDRQICMIGYMGYFGVLTAFNDDKVYAAILDSSSGEPYDSTGRRSYPLDLRYALENNSTIEGVAEFMMSFERNYTFNHLVSLADPDKSVVLENNFSGLGADMSRVKRAIRYSDSQLNKNIEWGIDNSIAAVNSFVLLGNADNHTTESFNVGRWKTIRDQLQKKGETVTVEELKEVITYKEGKLKPLSETSFPYNRLTIQSIVFEPDTFGLQVYFRPKDSIANPDIPIFESIKAFE